MPNNPNVPYTPVQQVEPNLGMPNDYESSRASASSFGGQTGQATQGLGKAIGDVGEPMAQYALARQGQINEANAINAETKANIAYGQIMDKFRNLEGPAAEAALPETRAQIEQVRQQIRATLPTDAAAKSFDMLISRSEGFLIRDLGQHATQQTNAFIKQSLQANHDLFVNRAGLPEVANNPSAWDYNLEQLKATGLRVLADGPLNGTFTTNPTDGSVTFNDDENGQKAKAIFDDYIQKSVGQAYEKKYQTLLDDPKTGNAKSAVDLFEKEKDDIPAVARGNIGRALVGPYRNILTRQAADETIQEAETDRAAQTSSPENNPTTTNDAVYNAIKGNEGGPKSNVMQIKDMGIWRKYSKPGEFITDPVANEKVARAHIDDLMTKYHGDGDRVATAYFSGEGNVNPDGPVPYKDNNFSKNLNPTNPTVAEYIDRFHRKMGGVALGAPAETTRLDYYREHGGELIQKTMDKISKMFPEHPELAWQAGQRTEQYVNSILRDEERIKTTAFNNVWDFFLNQDKKGLPVTSRFQIENDPSVSDSWKTLNKYSPFQSDQFINRMANANVRGKAGTYGENFWQSFQDVIEGKVTDPMTLTSQVGTGLTNTGMTALKDIFDSQADPNQKGFSNSMLDFYRQVHNDLVMTFPGDLKDVGGERKFQQFMMATLPEINGRKGQGDSADTMFKPESQNSMYNYVHLYRRSEAEMERAFNQALQAKTLQALTGKDKFNFNSLDAIENSVEGVNRLGGLVSTNRITPEEADAYLKKRNWQIQ